VLHDSITRTRGTLVGGTEIDWSTPGADPASYAAEVFAPSSDEDVVFAQRVSAQYVCQAVPAADIVPTDRIAWQGDTYEIASGVDKLSAHGTVRHLKFLLRRVTGG
jgi:hypothetical protein